MRDEHNTKAEYLVVEWLKFIMRYMYFDAKNLEHVCQATLLPFYYKATLLNWPQAALRRAKSGLSGIVGIECHNTW